MGTRKSTTHGQSRFSTIPAPQIQRSTFNRDFGHKTTINAGGLYPIFVDEALPGDTMAMSGTVFGRIATLLHPIMDNMYLDTFFFAVPMRLLWENWEKFMGAQDNPDDSTDYLIPTMTSQAPGYPNESLQDYLGIPTNVTGITHSSLPLRAVNLIWNEWFRDQNLQDSLTVELGDGPDNPFLYSIPPRGKRHDYMTSCLPWPQKGDSVEIGLGDQAPLVFTQDPAVIGNSGNAVPQFNITGDTGPLGKDITGQEAVWTTITGSGLAEWEDPNLIADMATSTGYADLSSASAANVNQLRQGFQVQRLLERDARGGTRYSEIVRSHFGVVSPDQRLQRPEFLGGGTTPLFAREVPATSQSEANLGDLGAYGTVVAENKGGWRKSFTEHCLILGFVCLRADLNYQQGLERMWSRSTKYDFYWPTLAHLGEQAVLNQEIYAQGTTADTDVFGYQERYAEYRYKPSRVSGKFRSNDAQSLDTWHLSQDFDNLPVLGDQFIQEDPPIDRVIAVQTEPHLLLDTFFQYRCARPMPVYSVPGMIDHF